MNAFHLGGPWIELETRLLPAVSVWTGAVGSAWSNGSNWQGGVAPSSGDDLVFPAGASNLVSTDDFAPGTPFGSITVEAGGYALQGSNALVLGGGFSTTNNSGTTFLSIPIVLDTTQTFDVAAGGILEFVGSMSGAGGLTSVGGGTFLQFGTSITYTGTTTATNGTLILGVSGGAAAMGGDLVVDGTQNVVQVQLDRPEQIPDSSSVTILGEGGLFSVGPNSSESINGLYFDGGLVAIDGSYLDVGAVGVVTSSTHQAGASITSQNGGTLRSAGHVLNISAAYRSQTLVNDLIISAPIDSATGLTKTGAGSVYFSPSTSSTYSGVTTVLGGTVVLAVWGAIVVPGDLVVGDASGNAVTVNMQGSNQLGAGDVKVFSNSVFDLQMGSQTLGSITLAGGLVYVDQGSVLTVNGSIASLVPAVDQTSTIQGGGVLDLGGNNAFPITVASDANLATDLSISIAVQNGGLSKQGAGVLALSGANTFTGPVQVQAGALQVQNNDALGSTAGSTSVSSGASLVVGGGLTLSESLDLQGTGTGSYPAALWSTGGDNTLSGDVTLSADAAVGVDSGKLTLSGPIGGSYPLTKVGPGVLDVTGTDSSSMTTTVSGGTLLVDGSLAGGVFVNSGVLGGTGSIQGTSNTIKGVLNPGPHADAGALTLARASTTTFTPGSTFHVDILGPASYDTVGFQGSGVPLVDLGNTTLEVNLGFLPSRGDAFTIVSPGASPASMVVSGTFNGLPDGSTFQMNYGGATVGFQVGYQSTGVTLTVQSVTFTWSGLGGDRNWSTGANWVGGSAPTWGADLVFPDGASRLSNVDDFASGTHFGNIEVAASGYGIGGNSITLDGALKASFASGQSMILTPIVLTSDSTVSVAGGVLRLSGAISGAGYGITKTGGGTLRVAGPSANSYTGTTTVAAGILELVKTAGIVAVPGDLVVLAGAYVSLQSDDQIADASSVTVGEGATLDLGVGSDQIASLTLQGGNIVIPGGLTLIVSGSIATLASPGHVLATIVGQGTLDLAGNPALPFDVAHDPTLTNDFEIDASVADGGLYKTGSGVLVLLGTNTYDGLTEVNAGTLVAGADSALGSALGATLIDSGASLWLEGASITIADQIRPVGNGVDGHGALRNFAVVATLSGGVQLQQAGDGRIGTADLTTLDVAGVISDAGANRILTIDSGPAGVVVLDAANTTVGPWTVVGGVVVANHDDSFGDPNVAGPVAFATGSTLKLSGGVVIPAAKLFVFDSQPAPGFSKIVNASGDNTILGQVNYISRFLPIDVAAGTTLTLSGQITSDGDPIDKNGPGRLVLAGTNLSIGPVNAYAGTLEIDGDSTASDSIPVSSGATLQGTGQAPAVTVASGGTIAPGVSGPGLLTANGLDMASGSTFTAQIDGGFPGTEYSMLQVNGRVSLGGSTLSLGVSGLYTPPNRKAFEIISNDGSDPVAGTFAGLPEGTIFQVGGKPFQISYVGGDGNDVVLTSVAIGITPATLPQGAALSLYSQQLTASGGSGAGYVFSAVGLPIGLTISPSGLISGLPTLFYPMPQLALVTVTDGIGSTTTQNFLITINAALMVAPSTPMPGTLGLPYVQQVTGVGGSGTGYTYSATGLPSGLTMSPTGLITGVPLVHGPIVASVTVTDDQGASREMPYDFMILPGPTITTLTAAPTPSVFGQGVVFTAHVAPPAVGVPTPVGTVSFYLGATLLGSEPLDANGAATFTTSSLPVGAQDVTAQYSGDVNYQTSTSAVYTQNVDRAATTVGVAASNSQPTPGQPFTLTGTISPAMAGASLSFFDGTTLLGAATTGFDGRATLLVAGLGNGTHVITASFVGDANYLGATSAPLNITIAQSQSQPGPVTPSTTQASFGQPLVLSASFSAPANGSAPMTGTVAFYDGTTYLGSAPIHAPAGLHAARPSPMIYGVATLPTASLPVGDHYIRAIYSGDAFYSSATGVSHVMVKVSPATTKTTLLVNPTAQGVTLVANISATSPGHPTLGGTVAFYAGSTLLGSAPVVNNAATLAFASKPAGATYTAVYSGDAAAKPSSTTIPASADGPRVVSVVRHGLHMSPTWLVVNFDQALDPTRAQNPRNYRILDGNGCSIPVVRAVYNPTTHAVTLQLGQRLNLHWTYAFAVVGAGPNGVASATGIPLDGNAHNQPGTNYRALITWRNLSLIATLYR